MVFGLLNFIFMKMKKTSVVMYIFMVVENLIAEFTYQINTTLKLIHRVHIGLKWKSFYIASEIYMKYE